MIMAEKTKIAFIGLGSMGLPMAQNLVQAGYSVRGFDMRTEAMDALVDAGGEKVLSLQTACENATILILMVVNIDQARTVLIDKGALTALPHGAHVCLMATCPPDAVKRIAEDVAASGKVLVDAPVSGGVVGAKAVH